MLNTRQLVRFAMFIMIQVIFTQFIGITTPILRLSFTYLAMAWIGYFYGWKIGALIAIAGDLAGMVIYPKDFYFVGFTLSAMVSGALYGLLQNVAAKDLAKRVLLITVLDNVVVNLLMNTLWLNLVYGQALNVLLLPRFLKMGLSIPIMYFSTLKLVQYLQANKKRFM